MVREPPAQMFNTTNIPPNPLPSEWWPVHQRQQLFLQERAVEYCRSGAPALGFVFRSLHMYVRPPALCSQICQQGEGLSINMIPHFQRQLWYLAVVGHWSVPLGLSSNGGSAPSATKREFNWRAKALRMIFIIVMTLIIKKILLINQGGPKITL